MKKNIILTIFSIFIMLTLVGCTTLKNEPLDADLYSPVAIVSVIANDEVYWYGEEIESKGLLGEAFDALAKETDNEKANVVFGYTTDLLKSAEEQITKGIENRGFTLLAKEDVLSYNNLLSKDDSSLVKASAVILADGYKMFRNDTKYLVALGEKTSAKAFIQIYIDFCKTVVNGIGKNGEMTACVEIKFTIYGEDGKVIKMVNGYASNPDTIPVVAGVYNVEKLNALFPVALEEAVKKVCEKL